MCIASNIKVCILRVMVKGKVMNTATFAEADTDCARCFCRVCSWMTFEQPEAGQERLRGLQHAPVSALHVMQPPAPPVNPDERLAGDSRQAHTSRASSMWTGAESADARQPHMQMLGRWHR